MKKRYILLLAAFVWGTAQAKDNNTFYFTDAAVVPGETTSIELCMRNEATDLTCLEAEIQLPAGLSVVCDEAGSPAVTLYRNRSAKHEVTTNVLDNGNIKLLVSSIEGSLIEGDDGPLLSFCVQAEANSPRGECTVETVGESLLVDSEATAFYCVGVTGSVLITDDATSLDKVKSEELRVKSEDATYDLAGRKIAIGTSSKGKLPRGIIIKDGKKIMGK
jgi:hypothetical protein